MKKNLCDAYKMCSYPYLRIMYPFVSSFHISNLVLSYVKKRKFYFFHSPTTLYTFLLVFLNLESSLISLKPSLFSHFSLDISEYFAHILKPKTFTQLVVALFSLFHFNLIPSSNFLFSFLISFAESRVSCKHVKTRILGDSI
jgi:hypothetical protein